jgi:hypothetical protein
MSQLVSRIKLTVQPYRCTLRLLAYARWRAASVFTVLNSNLFWFCLRRTTLGVIHRGPRHDNHPDVRRMRHKKALKYISSLPAIFLTLVVPMSEV